MKKATCMLLVALFFLNLTGCGSRDVKAEEDAIAKTEEANATSSVIITAAEETEGEQKRISGWSQDSTAMVEIIAFVENITDEASPDYVPPDRRIALFDFDGTLIGERYPACSDRCMLLYRLLHDNAYNASSKYVAFAEATEKAIANHKALPVTPRDTVEMCAKTFAGCTLEEYKAYIKEFMKQPVPGFKGMTYGTRFFVPMVELVRYLVENDFMVYICSGTERNFLRAMTEDTLGDCIPPYRVIGSTISFIATGQNGTPGCSYIYGSDDRVLVDGDMTAKNMNMNKIAGIINEIGEAPVLVFGNSYGDFSMAQYALQNGGKAWMLLCDDTERDYGDMDEATSFAESCEKFGFGTISMRDEFETIYDDDITMEAPIALDPAA